MQRCEVILYLETDSRESLKGNKMKLRSIALAGLLGAGLMMSAGCTEDDVVDAINDALKTNVIYVANATAGDVTYTIEGELNSNSQIVGANESKMFFTQGQDTYTVANSVNNEPRDFAKDSAHLYAQCNSEAIITDTATGGARQIEVVNLSSTPIDAGSGQQVGITLYNAAGTVLASATLSGQTLAACAKEALPAMTFNLSDVKTIEVQDINYTVPAYDQDVTDVLNSLNDVDFDIVVFDVATQKGTVVPLATAAQLGKAAN